MENCNETSDRTTAQPERSISCLPNEVLVHIYEYLDAESLCCACRVCKHWHEVINKTDIVWKARCLRCMTEDPEMAKDRAAGHKWKATFQRNYGINKIRRQWKDGCFSNVQAYQDLPPKVMFKTDATEWGEIFQRELER